MAIKLPDQIVLDFPGIQRNFEYLSTHWPSLTPAIVSANYTARAWDYVIASAGGLTITLPTAPPNGTQVAISGYQTPLITTYTIVNCGGSDHMFRGGTSLTSTTVGAATLVLEYETAFNDWRVLADTEGLIRPWAILSAAGASNPNTNNTNYVPSWTAGSIGGGMNWGASGISVPVQGIYRVSASVRADHQVASVYSQLTVNRYNSGGTLLGAVVNNIQTPAATFAMHTPSLLAAMSPLDYFAMAFYSNGSVNWQLTGWTLQFAAALVSWGLH